MKIQLACLKVINMVDKEFTVTEEYASNRLDKYLEQFLKLNRSQIKKRIDKGDIKVNKEIVKAGYSLNLSDVISVKYEDKIKLVPKKIDFNILYEDYDLAIISKPIGLVVQPTADNLDNTLVNGLLYQFGNSLPDPYDELRPGIVHRLDKDTSGLMVIAKTTRAYFALVEMFKNHKLEKHYLTIVHGVPDNFGEIDRPIGRDPNNRTKMKVTNKNSKDAYTSFSVIKDLGDLALLDVNIKTGRMHQIRVHLSYINHPVVGDLVYGHKNKWNVNTQLLHSNRLIFNHPITGKLLDIQDEFPIRFKDFIDRINI